MEHKDNGSVSRWLSLTNAYKVITNELEIAMQHSAGLTLKEFYVLLFLSETPEKKLKLQQLQKMVGLSQSAMSRLVARFEAKGCGALKREICLEDRRNIYTSITEIGEEKLNRALDVFQVTLENTLEEKDIQVGLKALLIDKK
ncbi:transcriptional regulator [Pullulanibacillus camelliae]|uniref:Transcriptional regulator n=1 Tax=Pullulanibacillus camelliae TaxID=1707096 RepID=A0A8J3DX42_9BACL|nr:MarR family transcriptional regulator [Pullulanibacillus camelliae]GGE50865.1 transcriptional regulator [Pullulanibacillus camelliae]